MPRPASGYKTKDGSEVPGCTSIIGRFKESGPLLAWAGRIGYEQGKRGEKFSLYAKRDEAADIGTHAHALFEANRKHLPEPPTPAGFTAEQKAKAETAYLNALEWAQQVRIESVAVETSLVCECYRYGCTIDEVVRLNGKLRNFEWKASNGVYVDYLLQIAAQAHAWNCNHKDGEQIVGGAIVRFSKDWGDFNYFYFEDLDLALNQFVRFRDAYGDDKILKTRVR